MSDVRLRAAANAASLLGTICAQPIPECGLRFQIREKDVVITVQVDPGPQQGRVEDWQPVVPVPPHPGRGFQGIIEQEPVRLTPTEEKILELASDTPHSVEWFARASLMEPTSHFRGCFTHLRHLGLMHRDPLGWTIVKITNGDKIREDNPSEVGLNG